MVPPGGSPGKPTARQVWICGQGEFSLPDAQRKLHLPFEIVRARLDNGGGQCKDFEIYWADEYLAKRQARNNAAKSSSF